MALVNIEEWLAARGPRGAPATTGANPGAPPASLPPDAQALIVELEAEIVRQAELVARLQAALSTELERNAKLVTLLRGALPTAAAQARAPSRIIRKRRGAGGPIPAPPVPTPPAAA
jgi:hypothetical protein